MSKMKTVYGRFPVVIEMLYSITVPVDISEKELRKKVSESLDGRFKYEPDTFALDGSKAEATIEMGESVEDFIRSPISEGNFFHASINEFEIDEEHEDEDEDEND